MRNDEVLTLQRPTRLEIEKISGSRFIGDAVAVSDEAGALTFVDTIRHREPNATHHCWAFRLADGRERSSDAGEPGGTAGPPILRRIIGSGLHDVVVVVTRYYGGTNLGRGGLVRAYGEAAAAVLNNAPKLTKPVFTYWSVTHQYDLSAPVAQVLARHEAVTVSADYGEKVVLVLAVRAGLSTGFVDALTDATAGAVVAQPTTIS
ncbi:MAG: YigZ family protein [Acidimicrobiia bacterium]|nr:YigZ family protein [Acidimicrobiia bacterium]